MNDTNTSPIIGTQSQILMLSRHFGLDELIPGSCKWQIMTHIRDECYVCEQHVIALYIFTPRIGIISSIKDQEEVSYYKERISNFNSSKAGADTNHLAVKNTSEGPPDEEHSIPNFASANTDWKYQPMRDVTELCATHDLNRPKFLKMAIRLGRVSENRGEPGMD